MRKLKVNLLLLITITIIAQDEVTAQDENFNIIFSQDFEHQSVPIEYTTALWNSDWNNPGWRDSDHRWPGWWAGKLKDSIVIDPVTSSKVMKFSFEDTIADGYDGQTGFRGGDTWDTDLGVEPKEVYFTYNVMWRPGFDMTNAGKMPALRGGSPTINTPPVYGEGFKAMLMWQWQPIGGIGFYLFYQEQTHPTNGQTILWNDFQPEGLDYDEATGAFIFDVTEPRWYNITIRCVVNSFTNGQPNRDGILEGYVNGKLIEQVSGLYFLTVPDIDKGINALRMAHFFGGGGPPFRDEWSYFDDFICFTYADGVDIPRGNTLSPPGRVLELPNLKNETTVDIDIPTMPLHPDVSIINVTNTPVPNISIAEAKISSFGQAEIYDYGLTITKSEEPIADELLILASQDDSDIWNNERASRGLKALYFFNEGEGNQIQDNSDSDSPVNLEIQDPSETDWLPGRGLKVRGNTIISSIDVPTDLINSITSTLDLFLIPKNLPKLLRS